MKTKGLKEVLFKRVLPAALSITMISAGLTACSNAKKEIKEPETSTSTKVDDEIYTPSANETYKTVYVYSRLVHMSDLSVQYKVGEEITLAKNDTLSTNANDAINFEYDIKLDDKTYIKPEDKVTVLNIVYKDKDGNLKTISKNGETYDYSKIMTTTAGYEQVAFGISKDGKEIDGYVSYPSGLKLVSEWTFSSEDASLEDSDTKKVGEFSYSDESGKIEYEETKSEPFVLK